MATPLIDAMGAWLCRAMRAPQPGQTVYNIHVIVNAFGSRRAAARALGIAESTLRGWEKGSKPRLAPEVFASMARGVLAANRYSDAYAGITVMRIKGTVRVSGDERPRTINVGEEISRRKMQGILRAWAQCDDERAERLLRKAIDSDYAAAMRVGAVDSVWFSLGRD